MRGGLLYDHQEDFLKLFSLLMIILFFCSIIVVTVGKYFAMHVQTILCHCHHQPNQFGCAMTAMCSLLDDTQLCSELKCDLIKDLTTALIFSAAQNFRMCIWFIECKNDDLWSLQMFNIYFHYKELFTHHSSLRMILCKCIKQKYRPICPETCDFKQMYNLSYANVYRAGS
jgi:hypothetical protein